MYQVTPDKFRMRQGDLALWFTGHLSSGGKSDRIIGNGKDPVVRNSKTAANFDETVLIDADFHGVDLTRADFCFRRT